VRNTLKNSLEFGKVYKRGRSFADGLLAVYVLKKEDQNLRLGISVSKKVGNSVVRHRITRLIRESFRNSRANVKNGYDIVVVARSKAKGKNYFEINEAFLKLLNMHRIIEKKNEFK
jgi:ribonuclease P protein component